MKKSERTRGAILEAARAVFAEAGYDAATVRAIAERADIDPAMVIRYFGSKEGLFALASEVRLDLPDLKGLSPDAVATKLAAHFLDLWEDRSHDLGLVILLRAAATNNEAAAKIRGVFEKQVLPAIKSVGNASSAPRRAGLVVSQIFGFAFCRYVLKIPPIETMPKEDVVAHLGAAIALHLFGERNATTRPPK